MHLFEKPAPSTDHEIIRRGLAAKDLLDNPCFQGIIEEIHTDYVRAIPKCRLDQYAERESYFAIALALEQIVAVTRAWVSAGETRKAHLDAMEDQNNETPDEDDDVPW